ncbi:hypothetical protein BH09BAC5_BH09BAC5_16000 [soil metagenome]
MDKLFRILFSKHFFPERILFLAASCGILIDGWITGTLCHLSAEWILRVFICAAAVMALVFSFSKFANRNNIRLLALFQICVLLIFSAFLNIVNHFNPDNALTFLGAYIICSLYFYSPKALIIYLVSGLALAMISLALTNHTEITGSIFLLRLFLGSILILGLSSATRLFQQQVQLFSNKVAAENKSLNETKKALENRLTHEHLLAMVASRVNTAIIISGPDDTIEWVNEGFTELTGYSSDEVIGEKPEFLQGPETDPSTSQRIIERKNKLVAFHDIILNYKKDGTPIWLQLHITPLLNENGIAERFISILEDISDIKLTESELRRSRELLKAAQSQAKIGSWEWMDKSENVNCSDEMISMLGMEEVQDMHIGQMEKSVPLQFVWDCIHPGDLDVVKKSIHNGLQRNSPIEIDFRVIIKGSVNYVYLTAQTVSQKNERTAKLAGTIQNITERKRIEIEMQMAEKQYRSLFEHSQHMICIHDLQGTILSINPAGAHAVGYEPEEIIGRHIKDFFPVFNSGEYEKYIALINNKGRAQGMARLSVRGGTISYWL